MTSQKPYKILYNVNDMAKNELFSALSIGITIKSQVENLNLKLVITMKARNR